MKKNRNVFLQRSFLILCCLALSFNAFSGEPEWYGNGHFKISKNEEIVKVKMNKLPYESFSVNLEELNTSGGTISFEVKSMDHITLKVDGFTSEGSQINLFNETLTAGNFEKLFYNLSESEHTINQIIFYVNPGQKYEGEVLFKDLEVSSGFQPGNIIALFPNPTSDVIHIKLPKADFETIAIFDSRGRLVLEKQVVYPTMEASLNGQRAGIYFLKAKGPNTTLTQRFMVK